MSDATTFTIVVTTIASALTGLLTFLSTKGVDAWLKVRADARIDETKLAEKEEGTLRFIIGRQDAQIQQLQTELRELHLQHNDCEKKHESLKVRLEILEGKVEQNTTQLNPPRL